MDPSLILTPQALRFLALAILQTEDGGTIKAGRGDAEALEVLAILEDLGLLEPVPGGWVASELLLAQPWAEALKADPFAMVYISRRV
jgi:hypothetical protein